MKGKAKRILCLAMAVVMLLLSPVSSAMSNINEVHATGLEVYYGQQLFEMFASLYGVSQLGTDKDELYQEFGSYLNTIEKPDIWTIFQGLTNNNPKARVTKDILSSVYGFLVKKFGSLTAKSHQYTYSGYKYQSASFSGFDLQCLDFMEANSSQYVMLVNPSYSIGGYDRVKATKVDSDYSGCYLLGVLNANGTGRNYYTVSFNSYGVVSSYEFVYTYSLYNSGGVIKQNTSYRSELSNMSLTCQLATSLPYIQSDDIKYYKIKDYTLSDMLGLASIKPSQAVSSASWGSYNKKTIDAITDKDIDISAIIATVGAAGSAVKENTTTNADTGEDEYSDKIADAVASAVAKALTDAGVIAGTNTGTDTDDKDDTEVPAGLMGILVEILSAIKAIPQFITDNILDAVYAIRDDVKPLGGYIADARDKVVAGIESIPAYIESTSDKIADVIVGAQTALAGIFSNVLDEVKAIPKSIADIFTDVIEGAKTGWMTLWDWLKKILDAILSLPASIAELIEAILTKVFAPNLTKAQDQILVIQNKFGWVGVLNDCIKSNLTSLNPNSSPPVIYIDFTQAESSKYVKVGKQLAIDFSWYAKYKPTGDAIIGSFMWIVYLWYLWKRLPDIISGGGMLTMGSMKFEDNMAKKNAKETKGKE